MKSIEIDNIKHFTSQLFAGTSFDDFLTAAAQFSTAAEFTIDGTLNAEFLGEGEVEPSEERAGLILWKRLKPICFAIIKGKKVPQQFRIVFKMPIEKTEVFLRDTGCAIDADQISGLFLNVNYKAGALHCTTGIALKTFTLDKTIETLWDDYMEQYLKKF